MTDDSLPSGDSLRADAADLIRDELMWIRRLYSAQDRAAVNEVITHDCYKTSGIVGPIRTIVDVGAHIGCFAYVARRRWPLARIVSVEACPENELVLRKNVGEHTAIEMAACTYETNVALANSFYRGGNNTGSSTVLPRGEVELFREHPANGFGIGATNNPMHYWPDLRPLRCVTVEQLAEHHQFARIDLLKLDCEGAEFSILNNVDLSRVRYILGEYHSRPAFMAIIERRFAAWDKHIELGEMGAFWLSNPSIDLIPQPRTP